MKVTKLLIIIMLALLSTLLSGCYWLEEIETSEVGAKMNAGRIYDCVPSGQYSESGWFEDLKHISKGTMTFSVEDPEVATQDNQLVGIKITIQARRALEGDKGLDCESIKNLLQNWPALIDDQSFVDTVSATAREGIKNGTRSFTLTKLLDDRNGLSQAITKHIEEDALKYSGQIVNVTIENIALNPDYAQTLQEKALFTAQTEKELKRQELVIQQAQTNALEQQQLTLVTEERLKREQAQTAVDVEIATREGKKIAASNQIYLDNERAYELEKLRLFAGVLGDKSSVWFIPQGTDLTLLLNQLKDNQTVVPVVPEENVTP